MKIIKILEISWLVIAISGLGLAIFKLIQGNHQDAIYFFIFMVVALIFFFIRRRQRIRMEKDMEAK
ncbi:MAG: hypothetical protein ACK4IK_01890 [Bacteroidia bacterium]